MSSLNFATAYIDLALRGQRGVTSALAQMRQQFQQTTSAATTFRNLLNAGPGTRLAQQHLDRNALMAEVRAAEAGAGARAMAAPHGQAALRRQAAAQDHTTAATLRQEIAQGRAQDAYEQSPQGKRAGAEVRALRQQKEALEESRRRRRVIDEYGQLGGRMTLFKEALGKAAPVIGVATAAFAALSGAAPAGAGLAAHANPAGARNLATAEESVRIEAGRPFLDAQRRADAMVRIYAEEAKKEQNPGRIAGLFRGWMMSNASFLGVPVGGRGLFDLAANVPLSLRNPANVARENAVMAQGQPYQGPFPSRYQSFDQYRDAAQMAASNTTPLEAQNLQRQFENFFGNDPQAANRHLEAIRQALEEMNRNAGRFAPAWR